MPFFILAVSPASLGAALRKRAFSGAGLSRTGSFLSSFSESVLFYTLSGKLSGKIGNRRQRGRPLICFHFQVPVLPGSGGSPVFCCQFCPLRLLHYPGASFRIYIRGRAGSGSSFSGKCRKTGQESRQFCCFLILLPAEKKIRGRHGSSPAGR